MSRGERRAQGARWRLYAFPAWFRQRYGEEVLHLLVANGCRIRDTVDILTSAAKLHRDERARLKDLARHRRR